MLDRDTISRGVLCGSSTCRRLTRRVQSTATRNMISGNKKNKRGVDLYSRGNNVEAVEVDLHDFEVSGFGRQLGKLN